MHTSDTTANLPNAPNTTTAPQTNYKRPKAYSNTENVSSVQPASETATILPNVPNTSQHTKQPQKVHSKSNTGTTAQ